MNKKESDKDYIDEQQEWQRHQFDPGHFTGGRVPVWIKLPGKAKRLGAIFLVLGIFYGAWTIYNITGISKVENTIEQIFSVIFLVLASIIFTWAGIKLIKKSKKEN